METKLFSPKIITVLAFIFASIGSLSSNPVNEEVVVVAKIENKLPSKQYRQEDSDTEEENFSLSPTQVEHIGNNVVKVITSSLTGNVPGIFGGGLNLLNTNNRVNSVLGILGVTTPKSNATTVQATEAAVSTEDSDNQEEEEDEDSRRRKLSDNLSQK